jgi:hypothetical protein
MAVQIPPIIQKTGLPSNHERPAGVLFYRWWCTLFVVIYLGMSAYEILIAIGRIEPSLDLIESVASAGNQKAREEIIAEKRNDAPGVAVFTALIAATYGFAAFVPRKSWAWTFSLVMICTTIFPFVFTAAGTIPLVLLWAKPAMRNYFNKR